MFVSDDYLSKVSFLVVDDQDFIRLLVRQVLGVIGARNVIDFPDGEQAWKQFKHMPTDIVILDWKMEPVDGIELTRLIRLDPQSPNPYVPIIMMTAYSERARVPACLRRATPGFTSSSSSPCRRRPCSIVSRRLSKNRVRSFASSTTSVLTVDARSSRTMGKNVAVPALPVHRHRAGATVNRRRSTRCYKFKRIEFRTNLTRSSV